MFDVVEIIKDDDGELQYADSIAVTSSLEDARDEARMHMLAEPWTLGIDILELVNTGTQQVWVLVDEEEGV